ncbi:orotate phosphoribosyltransferase [Myxococcota bacterium]|jgi:orotate phosphoribosyltransferase|nr:orotate phosphoribosyltransferase [Myxococcota bacterium]MBU1410834.1 orotate phosphoribosyltransferase [Myxococcota bacterium]MBU1511809.1 orotate phosphoribosyltransferase [Myxococcota bacterium]PKN25765.1 MAG: orotate phosphoribosyltransferase [Deltaproteobacteria bacterium HGW-Deltaproteobacteria-22]
MSDPNREKLLELLVKYSYVEGEVTLASGKKSNFYVDCRQTVLRAEGHLFTGRVFLDIIRREFPSARAVGGVVLGACPIASAVSLQSAAEGTPLPAFYLRKEPKGHGMGRLLEGPVTQGTPVVVVEDVVTTGGSTLKAIESARSEGLEVVGVVALVDREENEASATLSAQLPFVAVFTRTDIMAAGAARRNS